MWAPRVDAIFSGVEETLSKRKARKQREKENTKARSEDDKENTAMQRGSGRVPGTGRVLHFQEVGVTPKSLIKAVVGGVEPDVECGRRQSTMSSLADPCKLSVKCPSQLVPVGLLSCGQTGGQPVGLSACCKTSGGWSSLLFVISATCKFRD